MAGTVGTSLFAQVGFIVKDLEATKRKWAAFLGVPVPDTCDGGEYAVTGTTFEGQPAPEANCLMAFFDVGPGLQLELPSEDTLAVSNVPASLNGWAVRVRFMGSGSSALTEPAYIYVGDFVNAYAEPIRAYKETYETGNQGNPAYLRERGLSEMAGYFESVGYALKDLDKDGTPELILAGITPVEGFTDSQGLVYGVYTLDGAGQPVSLAVSQARDRFFLRADSSLLRRGSGGAAYTYYSLLRLRDGALQVDEMVPPFLRFLWKNLPG